MALAGPVAGLAGEQDLGVDDGSVGSILDGDGLLLMAVHAQQLAGVFAVPWPGRGLVLDRREDHYRQQRSDQPDLGSPDR